MNVGERFAHAIAEKDRAAILQVLSPELDFKGVTPRKTWEAATGEDFVDRILLGTWFGPNDTIRALQRVETDTIADTERVSYRFELERDSSRFLLEQQAYYRTNGGRIDWLRIACSGYRPVTSGAEKK
jgi:hypothetical protein